MLPNRTSVSIAALRDAHELFVARVILYLHLAAIIACSVPNVLTIVRFDVPYAISDAVDSLYLFALAMVLCPLAMLIAIVARVITGSRVLIAAGAEALLCVAHYLVLIPAVTRYGP